MPDPNQPLLTPEHLREGWTPHRIGRRIFTLAETDSTNKVALAAAADPDADGLAVFADFQTAGRGRHGRTWLAPRGAGILCSVLLRQPLERGRPLSGGRASRTLEEEGMSLTPEGGPASCTSPGGRDVRPSRTPAAARMRLEESTHLEAGRLTLASAVAACEAIRRATDVTPAIKWPNDLRVGGRKLAGILIESRPIDARTRAWVIGIGINCYQQSGHFPPELRATATSLDQLSAHPVDRALLARELLAALDRALCDETPGGLETIHATWLQYAEPLGQPVHLRSYGHEYTGRTISVDPAGGLIVQCDNGRQQWFDPLLTTSL